MMAELRQTQQLRQQQVLAPALRQGLEILQAPSLELSQIVRQELEMNPALEEVMAVDEGGELEGGELDREGDGDDELRELEEGWRTFSAEGAQNGGMEESEGMARNFESVVPPETLAQHAERQVTRLGLDAEQHRVLDLLIGNLDEDGYLAISLDAVAEKAGVEVAEVVQMLAELQKLEPAGIGARDLKECLKLQLERSGEGGGLEMQIVKDALDLLGQKNFAKIAENLGVDLEAVRRAGAKIAALNPRPGRVFDGEVAQVLVPDVLVEEVDGNYVVTLVKDSVPRLRISRVYRDLLGEEESEEVRNYLREKIKIGKLLIKNIEQREQTLLSVVQEIVARQRGFLETGVVALVPLTMAEVAAAIGMHEATVSRAVAGKVLATPQGVFELRFLFSQGYRDADGEGVSNIVVKEAIAELVKGEKGIKPMSDQKISDVLRERGIGVARRTVAHYREELGILPAHLRKSF